MIAKTEEERQILRQGGKHLAAILRELGAMVQPGVNTQMLEDKARELIAARGCTPATLGYTPAGHRRPFPAALCVSINEEVVHGIPNEEPIKVIQDGDIVSIDCVIVYRGLMTDICRTYIAGTPDPEDVRLLEATKEALAAGVKAARVGNTIGDIGYAIEGVILRHGFTTPEELGGHGVGEKMHEEPFVPNWGRPGAGKKLKEGMVLALEPILIRGNSAIQLEADGYTYTTRDGSRAAQFEHTILITSKGAEILTPF